MVTKILIGWSFEPVLSSKAAAIAAAETAAATICNPSPVGGNDEHLAGVVVVVGVVAGVDRDTAVGCSVWVVVNIPFGRLNEFLPEAWKDAEAKMDDGRRKSSLLLLETFCFTNSTFSALVSGR